MRRRSLSILLTLLLALSLAMPVYAAEAETVDVLTQPLDYNDKENWAYFETDKEKEADVFLVCPTVDTKSYANTLELNDKVKSAFLYALDLEKGMYSDAGRLFSPYSRQMSLNAYVLPEAERDQAEANAYLDVSAAFRWYLDHENNGRPLILAGFSQGSQMCLELMKEYFGGDSAEAKALRDRLIAVYAIGWTVTEEMTKEYPQIVPAKGETDTGTVISFDCEDGSLTDSLVIPAGTKALSINPLNWKTDGAPAGKAQNIGAVMEKDADPIFGLCGAYIGDRGQLVVTDITPKEYPPILPVFEEGAYHIYDYMFFFMNLKRNVEARTAEYLASTPFEDVKDGDRYADAVKYVREKGLMNGISETEFSPDANLTRAQLITILWNSEGQPVVNGSIPFSDVSEGAWYTEAVRWASGEKIAQGYGNGKFGTDDLVTREQMVSLLWRMKGRPDAEAGLSGYQDAASVSPWAGDAVSWAVDSGVILDRNNSLVPRDAVTRGEAAMVLMNAHETKRDWPDPTPLNGLSDYIAWAEETGYPSGSLEAQGVIGINQDYYHTSAGSEAYTSGRIVIGDSRCCQLGIYQQRTDRHDYAVYAVWGGHYFRELTPPLMTDELQEEVEKCFCAQIDSCGKCTIYFFATVNDYDFRENKNSEKIASAVQAAERFASLSYTLDGVTYHPEVVVIGFDGGRGTGTIFSVPHTLFNSCLSDYNRDLRTAVSESDLLAPYVSRFTTVPEIVGGKAAFISDGLHYDDGVLADITSYLLAEPQH